MNIQFIVVTYKPDATVLKGLQESLVGKSVIAIDNSKKNLGFGGGANMGMRQAIERDAEWVVVLNQDIEMMKEEVKKLCERLRRLPPGIAGSLAGSLDKKRWTTILLERSLDSHRSLGMTRNVYISGSCMAIHKAVFEKIGYFYEPYFMYYEDADFCVRAKKAGFSLIHVPIAGISHNETTSLGRGSFLHQYYLARNHLLFVERIAPVAVKIHEAVRLPKTIWEHWKKGETGALMGIRDYFLRRFGEYKPLW